jgi:hypothetical protein
MFVLELDNKPSTDGLKQWTTGSVRVTSECELPSISLPQRVAWARLCAEAAAAASRAARWGSAAAAAEAAAEAAAAAGEARAAERALQVADLLAVVV